MFTFFILDLLLASDFPVLLRNCQLETDLCSLPLTWFLISVYLVICIWNDILVTPFDDNCNCNYFSAFKFIDYFWPNIGSFYACGKWKTRLFFIFLFLDNKWISFAVCLFINRSQMTWKCKNKKMAHEPQACVTDACHHIFYITFVTICRKKAFGCRNL